MISRRRCSWRSDFRSRPCCLAFVYLARREPSPRHAGPAALLAGLFLYTGYFLQTLGLQYTTRIEVWVSDGFVHCAGTFTGAAVYQKVPGIIGVDRRFARDRRNGFDDADQRPIRDWSRVRR